MKFSKTANFKSIQKFFHVYLPVAILLYAILWIGAKMYDDLHETLHDPIFIIAGLISVSYTHLTLPTIYSV